MPRCSKDQQHLPGGKGAEEDEAGPSEGSPALSPLIPAPPELGFNSCLRFPRPGHDPQYNVDGRGDQRMFYLGFHI